jgi:hypothetical protein
VHDQAGTTHGATVEFGLRLCRTQLSHGSGIDGLTGEAGQLAPALAFPEDPGTVFVLGWMERYQRMDLAVRVLSASTAPRSINRHRPGLGVLAS